MPLPTSPEEKRERVQVTLGAFVPTVPPPPYPPEWLLHFRRMAYDIMGKGGLTETTTREGMSFDAAQTILNQVKLDVSRNMLHSLAYYEDLLQAEARSLLRGWQERKALEERRARPTEEVIKELLLPEVKVPAVRPEVTIPTAAGFTPTTKVPELVNLQHFPPRDYQSEGLQAWLTGVETDATRGVRSGRFKPMKGTVVIPTGLGKTLVAIMAMRKLQRPTAIIVPTIRLMKQWVGVIRKASYQNVGMFYGTSKQFRPVSVFVYQSAWRNKNLFRHFGMIVFDEVHHLAGPRNQQLLQFCGEETACLGLTATISTRSKQHQPVLQVVPRVYRMTIGEGIKRGLLPPIKVEDHPVILSFMEHEDYDKLSQAIRRGMQRYGGDLQALAAAAYKDPIAAAAMKAMTERKKLLSFAKAKEPELLSIVKRHPEDRAMVFSESIDAITANCDYIQREGRFRCETYHSEKSEKEQDRLMRGWGKDFQVLFSVHALEEGIDVPEVGVGIFMARGRSARQLIQTIGRLIRPMPGKVVHIYPIFVPNTVEGDIGLRVRRAIGALEAGEGEF